jgi:Cdc6-like AAA superfamily ATPase
VDEKTKSAFIESVLPLYKELLKYQAISIAYFGKTTLTRLGRDILVGTRWQDALNSVKEEEMHSRTSTHFLGNQDLKKILTAQTELLKDLPLRLSSKRAEAAQVMHWTSQIPIYSDHCQIKAIIGEPSGQWLIEEPEYLLWRSKQSHKVLFLEGTVGQGKTSLVCGVIEDVLLQANTQLAFFYCSRNSSTKIEEASATRRDESVNCLRSVLAQFGTLDEQTVASGALMKHFQESYNQLSGGCTLSFEEALNVVVEIIEGDSEQSRILIIDALDECRDPKQLLKGLYHLTEKCAKLQILISSREGFLNAVEKLFPSLRTVKIENRNADDMNKYVHQEVQNRYSEYGFSSGQADRLETFLQAKASGM